MTEVVPHITTAFLRDFQDLLRRYDAEFDLYEDHPECPYVEIYFNAQWDEDGNTLRPSATMTLPINISPS